MNKMINGILLLDKPVGMTSNAALQQVKRLYQVSKAGHTGSLDPLACGMLPICLGEATKFSQFLLDADKHYLTVAKLGVKTTTGDAEGSILEQKPVNIDLAQLLTVLARFQGTLQQIPPMYAALKYQGKPLYKLARAGVEVERKARPIKIYKLELVNFAEEFITLDVQVSKGTYIRTLIEDIGAALGCGAHVSYLRRLSVAHFNSEQMITLPSLQSATKDIYEALLPIRTAVAYLPVVEVLKIEGDKLRCGQSCKVATTTKQGLVSIVQEDALFLGIGEMIADLLVPRRLIHQAA